MATPTEPGSTGDQQLAELRPERTRFHADRDLLRIEDVVLRIGEGIPPPLLAILGLRRGRAATLTRRIHKLFCALAAARGARRDTGGWLRLQDIAPLEGWAGDTAKRIANELELGPGEIGIIEPRGKGGVTQLRLRMPSELVSIGRLPDDVQARFEEPGQDMPLGEVRPQPVRDLKLANAVSEALRGSRLLAAGDEAGSDDRTLLVSPLYQGGSRSLVFGGLAVRPADSAVDEPMATSVLVKVAIGLGGNKLSLHKEALDAECALLGDRAGWPGLPVWVERRQIAPDRLLDRIASYELPFDPQPLPVMILGAGHPRTVEATPRLLRSVLDDTTAPMRRRTRRDLHNVMILAEQLATLTRLMHINRRAHRHLSTDAIVVRYEVGILNHVLAADLAASVPVRTDSDDLLYRDLFDLGAVLVHAITAVPLTGDRQDFQPPGFPGRALIKRAVEGEGETVLRLLFAIGRHLLEASPAASSAGHAAPTVRLLDDFLDELAHIAMLHWSRARGVPERRAPWGIGGAMAPASPGQHESLARSAADPVATRLVTISHLVSLDTLHDWCLRYVTNWWRESIESSESPVDSAEAPLAADRCLAILREGYGRSALAEMWRYLWNSRDGHPDHLIRVLRNYMTLWVREDRFDVAHELGTGRSGGLADELDRLATRFTEQLAAPDDRKLVLDWIDELRRTIPGLRDGARPDPRTVKDPRLRSWMHAATLRQLLRTEPRPPTEKDIHEVETALRGRNSPETVSWHILLARAWVVAAIHGPVKADQESGWDRAMRTLLVAAGVAAARQLPFEMVGTLSASAHLTRLALDTPRLRAELTAQGADEDGVRVQAAECALVAADGYLWLDNQVRHCRAVLEAAWLLRGSPFPERLIQAFQLLSLARNNRRLDWHPPEFDDVRGAALSPDRFVRYPASAADPARFTALERQLSDQTHEAWARSRGRIQPSDDPGTALEHGWFARYSSSLQSIFGPGGPRIELAQSRDTPSTGRPPDRAVRRLLQLAAAHYLKDRGERRDPADPGAEPREAPGLGSRILDFGCGAGDEAWDLARDHTVWAVDSPVWFAAAQTGARDRHADHHRPAFFAFHPVEYAQRVLDGELPDGSPRDVDVVLFRCSLCRVSRRDKLLMAAHKLLRPGGFVLATDWIQTRTCDRITWSRLMNTVRLVGLETRAGYQQLSEQLGKNLRFTDFRAWDWQDVAGTDEPPMQQFFLDRLEDTKRELAAEDADRPRPPHARAALLQAQRDLEVLTAMSTRSGPLGWLFWAARKPDPDPVVARG